MSVLHLLATAALDPSPDEARSWLRRELLRPEYQQDSPVQRILDWFGRRFNDGVQAASQSGTLTLLAALLLFALLGAGVLWLASRSRLTRRAPHSTGPVLAESSITAAELRERARLAFAEQRWADALVDAYRALAAGQVERGWLVDRAGATAHEVAEALAEAHPERADRLRRAADVFDQVLYGDRPAEASQATEILALDDDLVGVR